MKGKRGLEKSNTLKTELPLTEEEYRMLRQDLIGTGVVSGSNRLSSMMGAILPSTTREPELSRADTLENNPGCVDPSKVHEAIDAQERIIYRVEENGDLAIVQTNWGNLQESDDIPALKTQVSTPSTGQFPGVYGFHCAFERLNNYDKNKFWEYSSKLNKLFIEIDKKIQVGFKLRDNADFKELYVRAMAVYAEEASVKEPVLRCPQHADYKHESNLNFEPQHRFHLIRCDHERARYLLDDTTGRLSVVVPISPPAVGTDYCPRIFKFMCLGSDSGGINRRPVKLVFTLEHGLGNVVGRYSLDLRICACPSRDMSKEEKKLKRKEIKTLELADEIARSNSVVFCPAKSNKKRKRESNELEEMVMLPVSKADYEKLNEFAEAAMIVRNPNKKDLIHAERKRLVQKYNASAG